MLEQLAADIWVLRRPFQIMGGEAGSRMTVVRLRSGALVLHSPVELDQDLALALRGLGEPSFIVAPNRFHHLAIASYLASFPHIKIYMAPGLQSKRTDLPCHGVLPEAMPAPWRPDIALELFGGAPRLSEVITFHVPSKTLILTDLALNIRHPEGLALRLYLRVNGAFGRVGTPWLIRRLTRDRAAARASLQRVLKWDFQRIVVAHGEVVDHHARLVFEDTFAWALTGS